MRSERDKAGEDLANKWMNEGVSVKLTADAFCAGISVRVVGKITNCLGGMLVVKGGESEVCVQLSGAPFEVRAEDLVVPLRVGGGSCLLSAADK
jgi:RNase P/RNase MRP subunit p29